MDHGDNITGPDRQCNCTDKTKEMELLRVWQSHRAENMKKVWKQRGGTYGVGEGQVINTRFGLLGIFRCVNSLIKIIHLVAHARIQCKI